MKNQKFVGYSSAIIATALLASLGIFVRNISASEQIITLARLGLGVIFLAVYLLLSKKHHQLLKISLSFPLIATGVFLSLTILFYTNAINNTSLSNAVFLLYLGPLMAAGLAVILLKEKLALINGVLLCLAFFGCLFIFEFKFTFDLQDSEGYFWGIGAALFSALFIVFNRKIAKTIPFLVRSFYQLLIGAMIMVPFVDSSVFSLSTTDLYWLTAIGFFQGFIALTLIVLALKQLKAYEFGTISYIEPLIATLIGIYVYSESISVMQLVGCAIIFFGGFMQVFLSRKV